MRIWSKILGQMGPGQLFPRPTPNPDPFVSDPLVLVPICPVRIPFVRDPTVRNHGRIAANR